ncbi:hypothetical protein B0I35DRAFT_415178 [Stachybotrys elegans]|uniref:Uncharacterized protein n=1 Tax=Stachybotrys elegans TaxID=80388 RepID=A0A8K0SD03_9HYPO|nr:hypothetical protein B0I35DRAFT_415178 [Stachybotrys elegans]
MIPTGLIRARLRATPRATPWEIIRTRSLSPAQHKWVIGEMIFPKILAINSARRIEDEAALKAKADEALAVWLDGSLDAESWEKCLASSRNMTLNRRYSVVET